MAKSKSQQKREAIQKEAGAQAPGWVANQQKETKAKDSDDRHEEAVKEGRIKVKMLTDYRGEVSKGQIYETDEEKAAELVRLKRAEYQKRVKEEDSSE